MPRIDLGQIIEWISWSAVVLQFLTAAVTARSALGRHRCCSGSPSQPTMHSVPRLLLRRRYTRPDLHADSPTSGSVTSDIVAVRLTLKCNTTKLRPVTV